MLNNCHVAQEELAIKEKLVEQMDTFEKQYSETITKLSDIIEKLTNSISEGFFVLKCFMILLPPTPYAYQGRGRDTTQKVGGLSQKKLICRIKQY